MVESLRGGERLSEEGRKLVLKKFVGVSGGIRSRYVHGMFQYHSVIIQKFVR